MKSILLISITFSCAVLAGCGGSSSSSDDDLLTIAIANANSGLRPADVRAVAAIDKPDDAVDACVTTDAPGCDAEISTLAISAYEKMVEFYPDIELADIEETIEDAVFFLATMGGDTQLVFKSSNPEASLGTSVMLTPGASLDDYYDGGATPVLAHNGAVYADQKLPAADPDGEHGWYFKKESNTFPDDKINWYVFADDGSAPTGFTIGDMLSLEALVTHYVDTTRWFFNVYTLPEGAGDQASWYRSRVTINLDNDDLNGLPAAPVTYLAQYDREGFLSDGDVEMAVGAGTTELSDGNATLADIADERIMLIAFGTNSASDIGDDELLLEQVVLGVGGNEVELLPVYASDPSDENFYAFTTDARIPHWLEVDLPGSPFDGLVFEINGRFSHAAELQGGDITLAMKTLLKKLDRGNGFNALVPEPVFNNETGKLEYDFASALDLADIAGMTVNVYSDESLNTLEGDISIAADGKTTNTSM